MFTGLVEAVGTVLESRPTSGGKRVRIETTLAPSLEPGDSLAVNGVCLTVVSGDDQQIHAEVGPETLRVTTLGALAPPALVNLERPLRADSRFGGHFVQGHVDTTGVIEAITPDGDFHRLTIGFPRHLAPYVVPKGSIAVDGISLTVANLAVERLDIMIVPFTLEHTNLKHAKAGDRVNLECDMVGKYVVRAAELAGLSFGPVRADEVRH